MSVPMLWRPKPGQVQITYERASQDFSFPSSAYTTHHSKPSVIPWSLSQHPSTTEYDWMQACRHWFALFRRIHPERGITTQMPYDDTEDGWLLSQPDLMKPAVILASLTTLVLEERPSTPDYATLSKRLDTRSYTKKYNHYNTVVLSSLARDVANSDLYTVNMVLRRLNNFIQGEIALNSPTLSLHLKGFAAILAVHGGIRKILERQETTKFVINSMLVATTAGNTTSPAKACLPATVYFVNDDAYLLYASHLLESFPCPTQLYRCIVDITWLRVQHVARQCDRKRIRDAVATILGTIQGFNPETWSERPELRSAEVRHSIAQIYHVATELYLRLSLVEYVSMPLTPSQRIAKATRTTAIAERLVATCGYHLSLAWPLTVAGAALGRSPTRHQAAVDGHLQAISRMTVVARGLSVSLQYLRKFWASGKTGWEDCFSGWHISCF